MARYPARKGVVYLSTTIAGVASAVLGLNKWTLNRTTTKIDVTAFGDPNMVYVQGLADVKGTISGFWDDQETKLFTAAASASGVNMYLYPSADAPSKYHAGPAWLDMSMDESVSGAVQLTGNFAAAGAWASTI